MKEARLKELFEIGGSGRLLPMEGIRAVAVFMVFLQHYFSQFVVVGDLSPDLLNVGKLFTRLGNHGVELFFVLSGYLIYGMLIRNRPRILPFLKRRAIRLYPAFIVALAIGAALDPSRPSPKVPPEFADAAGYMLAQLAFLPGLFDIKPLFAVNWSLSYEWWFYLTCVLLYCGLGMAKLALWVRVPIVLSYLGLLVGLDIFVQDHVPIRGASLFGGMLLFDLGTIVKRRASSWGARAPGGEGALWVLSLLGVAAFVAPLAYLWLAQPAVWAGALAITAGFTAFVGVTLIPGVPLGRALALPWLRYFGNMSYSYYLVHGFVVVILAHLWLPWLAEAGLSDVVLVTAFLPCFIATLMAGAALYLLVERPYSLRRRPAAPAAPSPGMPTADPSSAVEEGK